MEDILKQRLNHHINLINIFKNYEEHFENIIYNKEKMVTKLNKEINSFPKEIRKKAKIVNKINTKAFFSFVDEEIKKRVGER